MSGAQSALFNFEMSGAHASLRFWECTHEWRSKEWRSWTGCNQCTCTCLCRFWFMYVGQTFNFLSCHFITENKGQNCVHMSLYLFFQEKFCLVLPINTTISALCGFSCFRIHHSLHSALLQRGAKKYYFKNEFWILLVPIWLRTIILNLIWYNSSKIINYHSFWSTRR